MASVSFPDQSAIVHVEPAAEEQDLEGAELRDRIGRRLCEAVDAVGFDCSVTSVKESSFKRKETDSAPARAGGKSASRPVSTTAKWSGVTVLLSVNGMTCTSCSTAVRQAIDSVSSISVATPSGEEDTWEVTILDAEVWVAANAAKVHARMRPAAADHSSSVFAARTALGEALSGIIDACGFEAAVTTITRGSVRAPAAAAAASGAVEIEMEGYHHGSRGEGNMRDNGKGNEEEQEMVEEEEEEGGEDNGGSSVLLVSGMTCSSCARSVEGALLQVEGVEGADVSVTTGRVQVFYSGSMPGERVLLEAVERAGFEADLPSADGGFAGGVADQLDNRAQTEVRSWAMRLGLSILFTVPLLILTHTPGTPGKGIDSPVPSIPGLPWRTVVMFLLVLPVQFGVGLKFYKGAWHGVRGGILGMDFLIITGTSAAFIYSVIDMFVGIAAGNPRGKGLPGSEPRVELETSGLLFSFVILGKLLEALAKRRTSRALTELVQLQPSNAMLLELEGAPEPVSSNKDRNPEAAQMPIVPEAEEYEDNDGPAQQTMTRSSGYVHADPADRRGSEDWNSAPSSVTGSETGDGDAGSPKATNIRSVQIVERGEDKQEVSYRLLHRERMVASRMLCRGDYVKIMPGSSIPADGVVVAGESEVNESMLTGEPLPVSKHIGSELVGGTVNGTGVLYMRTLRVGSSTALARIVRLVEEAQGSQAPIQAFADVAASYFTPVVLTLATVTAVAWIIGIESGSVPRDWLPSDTPADLFALMLGVSVVVVSCPCALGLAVPTAVMVGTGVGARFGVLIKGGATLEAGAHVQDVIFDKTGTLTAGKPTLAEVVFFDCSPDGDGDARRADTSRVLSLVASAECASEHPLARAIVEGCSAMDGVQITEATGFRITPGRGLVATVDGDVIRVGNTEWMRQNDISVSADAAAAVERLSQEGCTAVLASVNDRLRAVLALSDRVKEESPAVVRALHRRGLNVWMVTGDARATAEAAAAKVGIPCHRVLAGVRPEDKARVVQDLAEQQQMDHIARQRERGWWRSLGCCGGGGGGRGQRGGVVMVGDGVNDSPALAVATVGVAIGAGAQVAVEAADVVLVREDLSEVVTALDLSRATLRRIWANLMWAVVYNLLAIPIAAGVLIPAAQVSLPPAAAGALMATSSVSVVLSSLYLRRWTRPDLAEEERLLRTGAETSGGGDEGDSIASHESLLAAVGGTAVDVEKDQLTGEGDAEQDFGAMLTGDRVRVTYY